MSMTSPSAKLQALKPTGFLERNPKTHVPLEIFQIILSTCFFKRLRAAAFQGIFFHNILRGIHVQNERSCIYCGPLTNFSLIVDWQISLMNSP